MGDPLADAAVASLAGHGDAEIHRLLEFFERTSTPPPWLDGAERRLRGLPGRPRHGRPDGRGFSTLQPVVLHHRPVDARGPRQLALSLSDTPTAGSTPSGSALCTPRCLRFEAWEGPPALATYRAVGARDAGRNTQATHRATLRVRIDSMQARCLPPGLRGRVWIRRSRARRHGRPVGRRAVRRCGDPGCGCRNQDEARFAEAPDALREFFDLRRPLRGSIGALNAGCAAFQADPDLFILGLLAGGLVRGFSTLISLSFFTTGRLIDHAVRRLKHNIRQLVEVTFPGGLERHADGWKYTVRIRFVHAQVRRLIRESVSGTSPCTACR